MNLKVGDTLILSMGIYTQHKKKKMGQKMQVATVHYVGQKFAVLDFGLYRESYAFDELERMVIKVEAANPENSEQDEQVSEHETILVWDNV